MLIKFAVQVEEPEVEKCFFLSKGELWISKASFVTLQKIADKEGFYRIKKHGKHLSET